MTSLQSSSRLKLKKDDPVIVVRGKKNERGKIGKILRIIQKKQRVVVEKVHLVKEYVRANPQKNIQGGIVDREGSIPLSSVMYYCKECEQGVRVGFIMSEPTEESEKTPNSTKKSKFKKNGKENISKGTKPIKQRICKKCGVVLD